MRRGAPIPTASWRRTCWGSSASTTRDWPGGGWPPTPHCRGGPAGRAAGGARTGRPTAETQRLAAPAVDGADLVLTVDQVVQHIAERELEKAVEETGAVRGMVLVMDPRTGEMLALAAVPTYNPGAFQRVPPKRWVNRPIGEVFEPGSTFKLITAAAALDSGRVDLTDVFDCPESLQVGTHRIRDAHRYCTTSQTLTDVIRYSSNVGAAEVAARLGKERLYEYIRRFGFGAPTGIDLPGEAIGIVRPPQEGLGPGLQTIGFGQGISATPLQMLVGASALANDGVLVRPHVVRMVRDREGRLLQGVSAAPRRGGASGGRGGGADDDPYRGGRYRQTSGRSWICRRGQDRHGADPRAPRRVAAGAVHLLLPRIHAHSQPAAGDPGRARR